MTRTQKIFTDPVWIVVLAVVCMALWGSAYPGVKAGYTLFAIDTVSGKILFAGIRFALAGLMDIFVCVIRDRRFRLPRREDAKGIAFLTVVMTMIQYIFYYLGLANTTGVKGAILYSLGPIIMVLAVGLFGKSEKLTAKSLIGCALGLAGVVIINLKGGTAGGGFHFNGEGFLLIAIFAFSIGSLASKEITKNSDAMQITGWYLFLGGVILTAVALIAGGRLPQVTVRGVILLLYLAVLSASAFCIWTTLLKYNPAGQISVYNFLTPLLGVVMSGIFLHEEFLNFRTLLALVLACVGIYIVNKVPKEKKL